MTVNDEGQWQAYQPPQQPPQQPMQQPMQQPGHPVQPAQPVLVKHGGFWISGSLGMVLVFVLIGLVVLAIGYFTVIQVFGVPWYAAIPLSLVAGAGILLYEMTFSWKAWLAAFVLVGLAAVAAFGWWFTDVMG